MDSDLDWLQGSPTPEATPRQEDAFETSPTVRRVALLLEETVRTGASALHLEPDAEGGLRVRLRLDGVLHDAPEPKVPASAAAGYLNRLKILANLDISERRLPQTGGLIAVPAATGAVRFGVETLPGPSREMLVLRRLDPPPALRRLDGLGLLHADLERLRGALGGAPGVVLVAGPRRSGKRTLLEACLAELASPERCLISIGTAPREIPGVVAVPARSEIGLDRSAAFREASRKSPDVVALDDLRGHEATALAFESALAGMRVLAGAYGAGSAAQAVERLLEVGLERFVVARGLALVVATRLLRRLCPSCKATEPAPDRVTLERLAPRLVARRAFRDWSSSSRAVGCAACARTGYRGLVPVLEAVAFDERLRSMLAADAPSAVAAIGERTTSLREAALLRAYEGVTTVAEALAATPQARTTFDS
jgi:type IV pilus assembly protein PilB